MAFEKRADNVDTIILPSPPYVLTPSGDFDGNDGKWSTFTVNIGDSNGDGRGQNFRVLVSTSSSLTLVPEQASWCNNEDCAKARGVEIFNSRQSLGFDSKSSNTWAEVGLYNIPVPDWWPDEFERPNGTWGSDNVGLGESSLQSKILQSQWVVEYTSEDLFMGSFGLAVGAVDPGSGPKSTFLTNFAAFNQTPSTSYGYTAGAYYRNNKSGAPANLVLGGYDQSRFASVNATIPMPSALNNTLIVGVRSITYNPDRNVEANSYSLTESSSGFKATIDSTLPYLLLPDAICDEFAQRFQLQYDKSRNLYTVNDTAHRYNQDQNATVTFTIAADVNIGNGVASIDLPYAAFDLQAGSPIFSNDTSYFPIKKSPTGIFVLGRTFLQEAYIVVDYERTKFYVAPAVFSDPMPEPKIVSIFKKDYVPPQASQTPTPTPSGDGGLSPGAVAGIVVGIVVVFLLAGLGAFFFWKKRRQEKQKAAAKISETDIVTAENEFKHRRVSELDSEPPGSPKPTMGGYYDREQKDIIPFPPINEMESPPAELYSPPPESTLISSLTPGSERTAGDYFTNPRRRGATRESSANNTPGTPTIAPIAELPGDDGKFQVGGIHFEPVASPTQSPVHNRGPSDTSLQTNIDEVISGSRPQAEAESGPEAPLERRSSHARGLSDTTVQSESTAISQPTPEELESWALGENNEPRRPLSE